MRLFFEFFTKDESFRRPWTLSCTPLPHNCKRARMVLRPQQTHRTCLSPSKRRAACLPLSLRATCRQPPTHTGQVFPDMPESCLWKPRPFLHYAQNLKNFNNLKCCNIKLLFFHKLLSNNVLCHYIFNWKSLRVTHHLKFLNLRI